MKLLIRNLASSTSEAELRELFEGYGSVQSCNLVMDKDTGKSKGFGFIVDAVNQEKYFCHVSGLIDTIAENDNVSFELEKGAKGMNAVRVTLVK